LLRDCYEAEVFLSLDAAADGEEFFREAVAAADSDQARLSAAVVLGQLLLLDKKDTEYAELTTATVLPLLLKLWDPKKPPRADLTSPDTQTTLYVFGGAALLPLYAPEFLGQLPREKLRELVGRWEGLGAQAADDYTRLALDLFLEPAHAELGQEAQRKEAARRLEQNPVRGRVLPAGGTAELIAQARMLPMLLEGLRGLLDVR